MNVLFESLTGTYVKLNIYLGKIKDVLLHVSRLPLKNCNYRNWSVVRWIGFRARFMDWAQLGQFKNIGKMSGLKTCVYHRY